jgi:glycosyltransferase involved in cell wall biosynthesis
MIVELSIIIPSYRRKDSLLRLLDALRKQQSVVTEIIIIDQNEEDFWSAQEKEINFKDVRFLRQKKPNVSAARNHGASIANHQHLLFIDDDLVPEENFCNEGVAFFQHADVKAFCPTVYGYEGKEEAMNQYKNKHTQSIHPHVYPIEETLSACLFFEKEFFLQTGGFDPILFDYAKSTEDQELFKRMQKRKMNFYHCDSLFIFHDDKTAGGCDLRSEDYWTSRYKFMKGWVYRYAMHNDKVGTINAADYFKMLRSAFLNKEGLKQGFQFCRRQFKLLRKAMLETKAFLKRTSANESVLRVDFLSLTKDYV